MRKSLMVLGLVVLAGVAFIARGPEKAYAYVPPVMQFLGLGPDGTVKRVVTTDAGVLQVAGAQMAPQVPVTVALPQGGDGACVIVGAGAVTEITCDAATAPGCYYRAVASYGAADSGFPTVKGKNNAPGSGDGGFVVAGADNFVALRTPKTFRLPTYLDSVCMSVIDGGTLEAAALYP